MDGFTKPPGPALVRVNGTRVTGPILVSNNAILQLGKTLYLKYIQPMQTKSLNSLTNANNNKMQIKTENANKIQQTITRLPSSLSLSNRLAEKQIDLMNEKNQNDDVMKLKKDSQFTGGTLSKTQTLKVSYLFCISIYLCIYIYICKRKYDVLQWIQKASYVFCKGFYQFR